MDDTSDNMAHDALLTDELQQTESPVDDDPSKWENMYYSSRQQQTTPVEKDAFSAQYQSQSTPSQSIAKSTITTTRSDIRIVTFDLDNTIWKTTPTISHANKVLNEYMKQRYGVVDGTRVEVEMGRLFGLDVGRYAGDVEGNEDEKTVGGNNNSPDDYSRLVENVGHTDNDDGVHIQSPKKSQKKQKPVYLTLLRKDAIRSLIQQSQQYATSTTTLSTTTSETMETQVDEAFELWMDARAQSISQNYAPHVFECLSNIRSSIVSSPSNNSQLYIGAITDGNSNPLRIPELSPYFDFVIRAEDVGVSKPDVRVYKAAVAALILQLMKDGRSVEQFFLGEEGGSNGDDDGVVLPTNAYLKPSSFLSDDVLTWKDVDEDAVEAFSDAVGPWWVHVGDDFFKDVVAAKEFQMRTVWVRELIMGEDDKSKKPSASNEQRTEEGPKKQRTVEDLVNDISKQKGMIQMAIGESEFLTTSLHEEFSDTILDRFGDLSDLLIRWHEEGVGERVGGDNAASERRLETSYNEATTTIPTELSPPSSSYSDILPNDQADTNQPSTDTKFCVFCGTKLPSIAQFCSGCGERQM